jgi:hypothetical protein
MPTVTLTTDFGLKDGFVGTLKGVIWSICPLAQIADISHLIAPQNVLEGAFALWRAYPFFPAGTVHLAVVDPGVGTSRRPLAARLGAHYFVGPDNGLFTPIYEDAEKNGWPLETVHLANEKYFLAQVSRTFHGRDIFAPVAAHLASGIPLADLGPLIANPKRPPAAGAPTSPWWMSSATWPPTCPPPRWQAMRKRSSIWAAGKCAAWWLHMVKPSPVSWSPWWTAKTSLRSPL